MIDLNEHRDLIVAAMGLLLDCMNEGNEDATIDMLVNADDHRPNYDTAALEQLYTDLLKESD